MPPETSATPTWHHLETENVLSTIRSNAENGLTQEEAKKRLEEYGPNMVTAKEGKSPLVRFLLQFHNALVYILLAATVVTFLLGEYVDSAVIFGVVFLNSVIGFVQESKAEDAIESLKKMTGAHALVLRGGEKVEIEAADVVPGDVVLLQSGDKVPADLRLLSQKELRIDESALTGESLPVDKKLDLLDEDTVLADRNNMAYAGTLVASGQSKGVVIATGDGTETGKIAELINQSVDLQTPLTIKIGKFSQLLLYAILGLSVFTFFVGMLHDSPMIDIFMASVALAVATIPEGLPAVVTITLAIGVSRMAKRNAIIRKLPAVETLGSTTIICSDKTGTLTQNQMTVQKVYSEGSEYDIEGVGYAPEGNILQEGVRVDQLPDTVSRMLLAGYLCNDSSIVKEELRHEVQGDPTEGALIVSAQKAGLAAGAEVYTRIDSIPFESDRMYMATLHKNPEGGTLIFMKGSVERVLERSSMDEEQRATMLKQAERYASKGLRVLAFAAKPEGELQEIAESDVENGMQFLGIQAMIDPPRPEAIDAIKSCQGAGVSVKMITGDHALTAGTIAQEIGLFNNPLPALGQRVVTGRELSEMDESTLQKTAIQTHVFARVAPEQKLHLVTALQDQGHIVAMTGDGVNDAPALKQANIGIAMGITGTEVSKEAADMILTDDNFASIKAAVEEGRGVFDNLIKFIGWILPTNLGQGLVILVAVMLGLTLPILPVQVLWLNMTTAVFLGLVLAFEAKEGFIMQRPPRQPDVPILTSEINARIVLVSVLLVIGAYILFELELAYWGSSVEEARTAAVTAFVIGQTAYLFNSRSFKEPSYKQSLTSNKFLWVGVGAMIFFQLLYVYAPFMNLFFQSAPIPIATWLMILVLGVIVHVAVEVKKYYWYKTGR